ncbi:MAG: hypothetical protein QX197_03300 [Methylococcaceae bacterium]
MAFKVYLQYLLFSTVLAFSCSAYAEQPALNAFTFGSYQKILAKQAKQPFILVIWSITCPSCVKDMALLSTLHKNWPALKMIMLSTDDIAESEQVKAVLAKNQLAELENWVFAEENAQKLNYEIDPDWYAELPRTYFFDAAHVRQGVSGVLSQKDYETLFVKIQKKPASVQ